MNIIFLGPPGAGKGTHAATACEENGIAHISTGDMLRAEIRRESELGKAAQACINRGELVTDDIIVGMVQSRIKEPDCEKGFLLDGFPRTIAQADALSKIAHIDVVINLYAETEVLIKRISGRRMCRGCGAAYHASWYDKPTCEKCGGELYVRDDDRGDTVLNRIQVYEKQTAPLIEYYEEKGLLKAVRGSDPRQVVDDAIAAILAEYK